MLQNRNTLQKGIDLLTLTLAEHVLPQIKAVYGSSWYSVVFDSVTKDIQKRLPRDTPPDAVLTQVLDAAAYLRLIQQHWFKVFSTTMFHDVQEVSNALGARNKVAHLGTADLDEEYATKALNSIANVCEQFDVEVGQKVRSLCREVGTPEAATTEPEQQATPRSTHTAKGPQANPTFTGLPFWLSQVNIKKSLQSDLDLFAENKPSPEPSGSELLETTYVTNGLRSLVTAVTQRLSRGVGPAVLLLSSPRDTGKSYALHMLSYIYCGTNTLNPDSISWLMTSAGVPTLPRVHSAWLRCQELDPTGYTTTSRLPGIRINTLWGEMTAQLSRRKPKLYDQIKHIDAKRVTPGLHTLRDIIKSCGPSLILIDEISSYADKLLASGPDATVAYNNLVQFISDLIAATAADSKVQIIFVESAEPNHAILKTIREAILKSQQSSMAAISKKEQAVPNGGWQAMSAEEEFQIAKRQILGTCKDVQRRDMVCKRFYEMYLANKDEFPAMARQPQYLQRLQECYPLHPVLADNLMTLWAPPLELRKPQRLRRLLSTLVISLRRALDNNLLIMPGSLPWGDPNWCRELGGCLSNPWSELIHEQIVAAQAPPQTIEANNPATTTVNATPRMASALLYFSSPTSDSRQAGSTLANLLLATVQPGESLGRFKGVLTKLEQQCAYIHVSRDATRFWYDVKPPLDKALNQHAALLRTEDVNRFILAQLTHLRRESLFTTVVLSPEQSCVNDLPNLQLVLLTSEVKDIKNAGYCETALTEAARILQTQPDGSPRLNRNSLVFLAPDEHRQEKLETAVRHHLALEQLCGQKKDAMAQKSLKASEKQVIDNLNETYCWLIIPEVSGNSGLERLDWNIEQLSCARTPVLQRVAATLRNRSIVLDKLAPAQLCKLLDDCVWAEQNDMTIGDIFARFSLDLRLPRLSSIKVLTRAIRADDRDGHYFAVAERKINGCYKLLEYQRRFSNTEAHNLLVKAAWAQHPPTADDSRNSNTTPSAFVSVLPENAALAKAQARADQAAETTNPASPDASAVKASDATLTSPKPSPAVVAPPTVVALPTVVVAPPTVVVPPTPTTSYTPVNNSVTPSVRQEANADNAPCTGDDSTDKQAELSLPKEATTNLSAETDACVLVSAGENRETDASASETEAAALASASENEETEVAALAPASKNGETEVAALAPASESGESDAPATESAVTGNSAIALASEDMEIDASASDSGESDAPATESAVTGSSADASASENGEIDASASENGETDAPATEPKRSQASIYAPVDTVNETGKGHHNHCAGLESPTIRSNMPTPPDATPTTITTTAQAQNSVLANSDVAAMNSTANRNRVFSLQTRADGQNFVQQADYLARHLLPLLQASANTQINITIQVDATIPAGIDNQSTLELMRRSLQLSPDRLSLEH